jgi:hypothetical protein
MKTTHLIWGLLLLATIIGVAVAYYFYQTYKIRNVGIEVIPTRTYVYDNTLKPFMQTDKRWALDVLGDSPYTLAEEGCVVTVVAALFEH